MIAYALPCPAAPAASSQPGVLAHDRSTHDAPGPEDFAPRSTWALDDLQAEVLRALCLGLQPLRRHGDVADELAVLGLAEHEASRWRATAAAFVLLGIRRRSRRPTYRMPARGRHAMRRTRFHA